jgi:hypothetical protein
MSHDHAHVHHDHKADARAAFTGLIVGAIFLLAVVLTIVKLTNAKFDRAHPPAAGASH